MAEKPSKKKEPWYVRAFNADYLARYKHRSDELARAELPFVIGALNLPAHPAVLDLCCGAGRHARTLAAALPQGRIAALDLSVDLLREAQSKNTAPQRLLFILADMRRIPLASNWADGVVNLFTSFGYFRSDREHLAVLTEVARVLKPGGRFVLDFFNRGHVLANLVRHSESEIGGERIVETRRYDARSRRIVKTIRIDSSPNSRRNQDVFQESIRAYSPNELKRLLIQAGLTPCELMGDLSGGTFDIKSSLRCVWISKKGT